MGVYFDKSTDKFKAQISAGSASKTKTLGRFATVEEAFFTYKLEKERVAKLLAEEYKARVDNRVYDALMNYKVEITD